MKTIFYPDQYGHHMRSRLLADSRAAILAGLRRPTVIIQEGGHLSPVLGTNLGAFLTGFQEAMA